VPEVRFRVRWPDDSVMNAYSPSSTIRDALRIGHPYPVAEFVARARAALEYGSERVAQRYGFGCAHAIAQIREIEHAAHHFQGLAQTVVVESFDA
jgi:uncharacterized repeat protein (TIGR04042 family)